MSEWKSYLIKELFDISSGLSKPRDQFGFGTPFLSFKDVFNNFFIPGELNELVNANEKEKEKCSIIEGDIFLTRTSEEESELGMSSVALKNYPNATFNGFTKRLRLKNDVSVALDPVFAGYLFRSPRFRKALVSTATITTRASLNNSTLNALEIFLPDIQLQKAIGTILKSIDDKIALLQRQNQTLEKIAQTLFKHWFIDFEFPNAEGKPYRSSGGAMEASEIGEIPAKFRLKSLGTLAKNHSQTFKFGEKESVVFVNTGDVQNGKFLHEDLMQIELLPGQAKKAIEKGDILYSEIRPINRRFAYVDFDAPNHVVSTKFMVIRSLGQIHSKLLYLILKQDRCIDHFNYIAESRSGTFPQITFDSVSDYPILLPDSSIQEKFVDILEPLMEKQMINEKEIGTLTKMRDTLLPKLMSGQIRIKDIELQKT